MGLLWSILTSPVQGFLSILKEITAAAQDELSSPASIQKQLLELQMAYELDEIEQVEYDRSYQVLMEKLTSFLDLDYPSE